ncbi:FAD-dependent monooxygenase [Streptomyces sp. NPDC049555]|uniref:FAD-dependent monooxygenase n=1 Tax=Streptomyces sp. NPDC049555 TaxID=3154930 RepID=UPI003430553E
MRRLRALVVGAGPAGLAVAALLRRAGLEVRLVERDGGARSPGSGLTLWPNAFTALEAIGAAAAVRAASAPADGLAMRTPRGATLQYVSGAVLRSRCGGTGRALLRADLLRALWALQPPGAVRFGARCVGVRQDRAGVAAVLDGGGEEEGDVLIGADGIRSRVRGSLFGGDDLRPCGYAVARGVAQWSDPGHPALLTLGAGRQFGLFPLPDGRMYWFAAFASPDGPPPTAARCLPVLARDFGRWHAPVPQVLAATDPSDVTVTAIVDRRPLRRWGVGAVTLAGDAAHPSAPALGQGTCQAFEDAVVLARCLASAGGTAGVPAALRAYALARRRRAHGVTVQSHWMGRLGQWRNPALVAVRDGLIRAMPTAAQVGALRTAFAFDA